jgi:hypothetical protein
LLLGGVPLTSEDAVLSSAPVTDALPATSKILVTRRWLQLSRA